jgi:hypothetical protein
MRWSVVMMLVAGCGRFGFNPLNGEGPNGGDDGSGVDGRVGDDANPSDASGVSRHYISGGITQLNGPVTSLSAMTTQLAGTNMFLVVAIHWHNGTSTVTDVQDSFGNGFSMVGSMRRNNSAQSQVIWVKRVTAGTSINVTFDQPTPTIDLQWAAYRDIDPMSYGPDISAAGTGLTADAGAMSLPSHVLIVTSAASRAPDASAGSGFTGRLQTNGGVLEDMEAGPGTVNATATLSSSNDWIIHAVLLRPI